MSYFLCQTNCDRVVLETRVNLLHFQKEKPFGDDTNIEAGLRQPV